MPDIDVSAIVSQLSKVSTDRFGLAGKVAVITGGTKGIGLAIAVGFAVCGIKVVVASRKEDHVKEAMEQIRNVGGEVFGVAAHMSKKDDIDELIQKTTDTFGAIDILVNNAAINPVYGKLIDLSDEAWEKIMSVNVGGYFRCSRTAARRMMEKRGGSIINMGSMGGFKAREGIGAYCISKAAIVMLTKTLARELAPYHIRVNGIAPSIVETRFSKALTSDSEALNRALKEIPLGRLAVPADIVGSAIFLASDLSSYITGHTLCVDGGREA